MSPEGIINKMQTKIQNNKTKTEKWKRQQNKANQKHKIPVTNNAVLNWQETTTSIRQQ